MTELNLVERFNSLAAAFVNCEISEAEFRRRAQKSFGYDNAEMRIVMERLRQQRASETQRIIRTEPGRVTLHRATLGG